MQSSDAKGNYTTVDWRPSPDVIAQLGSSPEAKATVDQVELYQREGVILIRGLFSDWVDRLRAGLQRNMIIPMTMRFPVTALRLAVEGGFSTVTATGTESQNTPLLSQNHRPPVWQRSLCGLPGPSFFTNMSSARNPAPKQQRHGTMISPTTVSMDVRT